MLTRRSAARQRQVPIAVLLLVVFLLAPTAVLLVPVAVHAQNPVFLGMYQWGNDLPSLLDNYVELDAWLGRGNAPRVALAGDFLNIEYAPGVAIPQQLNAAWDHGRIPFVKIIASRTAAEIAGGVIDAAISEWGRNFALWSQGGSKRAFLLPLPEMNGDWIPYYVKGTQANLLIQAWLRIRNLIALELQKANVPQNAISWVYAPNAWSLPGDEFERYYPGADNVDAVGISSYNWGACPTQFAKWETYDVIFKPYLPRLSALAPGKPLFIAETAVIDRQPPFNFGDRNAWLFDTYTRLGTYPRMRGVVYFNLILSTQSNLLNCPDPDFRVHIPGLEDVYHGFRDAVGAPGSRYGYWAPTSAQVMNIVFAPTVHQTFQDVPAIHPFAVEPGEADFSSWIQRLAGSGVSTGCSVSPPLYCPDDGVTRAQMAVFLLKARHGASYGPPPATGAMFADVPVSHPYAPWIERLAFEGITAGCGDGFFCPDSVVTRGQMAVFLLRGQQGGSYLPPPATGAVFGDVPLGHPFGAWIERLSAVGITGGCGGGNYCPDASVDRKQMAVFLVRAFNL